MKPVLGFAAIGFAGIALWKLAGVILIPLFLTALKLAFAAGLILFVFWFFNKRNQKKDDGPVSGETQA